MRRKIERGPSLTIEGLQKDFTEVKGSIDDFIGRLRQSFYKAYPDTDRSYYWIREMFTDHLIVSSNTLPDGEFYRVPYQIQDAAGLSFTFATPDQWEVVELTYVPSTTPRVPALPIFGTPQPSSPSIEASAPDPAAKKARFVESAQVADIELITEATGGKTKRTLVIKEAMVAGVINRNKRRYPLNVVKAAVNEIRQHLHESAGQGRLLLTSTGDQLVGEAEHPSEKSGRPNLLETVIKWDSVNLDESSGAVQFKGTIIETSKGKDILALMEGGVRPGGSLRAYGFSRQIEETGQSIEEVTELHFTGYDLVSTPGFLQAQAVLESTLNLEQEQEEMDPKKLLEMLTANPELAIQLKSMLGIQDVAAATADQMKLIEATLRKQMGIDENADLFKTLSEAMKAKTQLEDMQRKADKDKAIAEACKDLKFGALNTQFGDELAEMAESADDVPAVSQRLMTRYSALVSQTTLSSMGFTPGAVGAGVQVLGPVIERETGTPAFAAAAFHFSEALATTYPETMSSFKKGAPLTKNEKFAKTMLARFDERFQRELLAESNAFNEASQVADLNLPYSINRAIVQRLVPQLIALSVFDTAPMSNMTELLWYESYAAETGLEKTIVDEVVVALLGTEVALGGQRIVAGTVVVTNSGNTVTYTENTDYTIDYANGLFIALTGGAITASQSLKVDYVYLGIRLGESQAIERAKMTLASKSVTAKADRLATEISAEALLFSRSQLGYDLAGRTIANLIAEIRRKIDGDLFRLAISKVMRVASNTGGSWSSSGANYDDLVKKIGVARVKLSKRYYQPTSILMSEANADAIANWSGFTQAGARPDSDINAEGYVGRLKSLPVFRSTEFPDSIILVLNRELVAYRVLRAMELKGPFPRMEGSTGKMIANDQYYVEEFNASDAPLADKGSYITVT